LDQLSLARILRTLRLPLPSRRFSLSFVTVDLLFLRLLSPFFSLFLGRSHFPFLLIPLVYSSRALWLVRFSLSTVAGTSSYPFPSLPLPPSPALATRSSIPLATNEEDIFCCCFFYWLLWLSSIVSLL
jgi:hypothetical protein